MRLTDVNDPNIFIDGLFANDEFLFLGDLSGAGQGDEQGGGAVLAAASIDGAFDRPTVTATGKVARTLVVVLFGTQGGLLFTVQISVDFTATHLDPSMEP